MFKYSTHYSLLVNSCKLTIFLNPVGDGYIVILANEITKVKVKVRVLSLDPKLALTTSQFYIQEKTPPNMYIPTI